MTISYNLDVASSSSWSFLKIIFRWRGSIWKSVLTELCIWTFCYYVVFCIYRFLLCDADQRSFALFAFHLDEKLHYIPLTFLLGFFVTIVVDRWKNMFANIGFIDNAAFFVSAYVRGSDEETKTIRRNIVRYLCLTQVLILRDISIQVRKRFPNIEAVMDAGFIQPHEKELMDSVNNGFTKYWMPVNWVFAICFDLRMKGKITADVLLNGLLMEVRTYREKLQLLCNYDWVPVPLAYPQVVFLAVRVYFLLCLVSRQFIITENVDNYSLVDYYFPFMTMFQLIFYMGWLKVAEALLNPLGEDDDDFECNSIIDRNIAIGLSIVDRCYSEIPDQVRDKFEDGTRPLYSEESATMPVHALVGSATQAGPEVKAHVKMVPHKEDTTSLDHHSLTSRQNSVQEGSQLHKRNVANRIRESLTNRVFRLNRSMSLVTESSGIGSKISPIPSDTHLAKMMSTPTKEDPENGILASQNHAGLRRGSSADGAIVMAPVARRINSLTDSIQELPQRQQNGETPSRTLPPPLLHLDTVSEEGDVNNSPTTVSTNTSFRDKKK